MIALARPVRSAKSRPGASPKRRARQPSIAIQFRLRGVSHYPTVPLWKPIVLFVWTGAVLISWLIWKFLMAGS